MRETKRTIEGRLLLFATFILLAGLGLVYLAKLPQLRTAGTININTASPERIASKMMIDIELAKSIVRHRQSSGSFVNTSAVREVRLLSPEQIKSLLDLASRGDITMLTAGQISARADINSAVSRRLVDSIASLDGKSQITESRLAKISVVSSDVLSKAESGLRVRDPVSVTVSFWLYTALLIIGFFILHAILRRRAPMADPYILPCIFLLSGFGLIALFSIKDPLRDTDVFVNQAYGIYLGLLAALIPLSSWYRSLRPWRYTYIYAVFAVAVTMLLTVFGTGPGGAKLKLFGMQPVEIVKIALVFFVASYLSDRWMLLLDKSVSAKGKPNLPLFRDIAPLLVMYMLSLGTFILVRDLGPMLLLFGMFVSLLYITTGKPAYIVTGLIAVAVTGWIAYALHLGVFDVRVDMWLNPWKNQHPNGMQLGQALWGLGTGGIWGSGLGLGQPALMPRSGSDLVFAALGEELGLIGSLFILAICSIIIIRGFKTALHARTDFDRLLIAGVSTLLGLQAVIILFGVLGLIPLTGVTLPFISYGKSSVVASFFIAGLLLNTSSNGVRDTVGVRTETRRAVCNLSTAIIVLLLGVAGICRLVWIQGVKADQVAGMTLTTPDADGYSRPHINPRLKVIEASIPRGSVYDRNGLPLATSKVSELKELDLLDEANQRPMRRYYPQGSDFAHIAGYLDSRCGGPVGIEKWRNGDLRGFDDYSALLPIYRFSHTPYSSKIYGKDVRLTIDSKLQREVEKALTKYAGSIRDKRNGKRKHKGAAVVLDVYTGEVLALVSIPSFDPNELTQSVWKVYNNDEKGDAALFDRTINGAYPPGSTFKLVTAAAALENGIDKSYSCRHKESGIRWREFGKTYSRKRITDLEEMNSHGLTGLAKAIRVSCNIFFAHLGIDLGPEKLYEMTRKFGLTKIPPPRRLAEDLPDNAYGQGTIQVTPLEMARVVASIANGGIMMEPHFVKEISLNGTVLETVTPVEMGRPMTPENAVKLQKMMADVARIGTGKGLFSGLNVSVGGKTGSAENDQADGMPHSWFVGFAPVEDPRIAFAVVVENGGYGRAAAGPICREIVKSALD
ncbi:MAG: penicillin-binding transpeptidase domain-containing protein [Armatimonadota bacterium]